MYPVVIELTMANYYYEYTQYYKFSPEVSARNLDSTTITQEKTQESESSTYFEIFYGFSRIGGLATFLFLVMSVVVIPIGYKVFIYDTVIDMQLAKYTSIKKAKKDYKNLATNMMNTPRDRTEKYQQKSSEVQASNRSSEREEK